MKMPIFAQLHISVYCLIKEWNSNISTLVQVKSYVSGRRNGATMTENDWTWESVATDSLSECNSMNTEQQAS